MDTTVRIIGIGAFLGASALAAVLTVASPPPAGRPVAAVEVVPVTTDGAPTAAPPPAVSTTPAPVGGGLGRLVEPPPPAWLLPPTEAQRPSTIDVFYAALAPYGTWILIEGYGRCWRPRVAVEVGGWHPYGHGYWIATDLGWVWSSDEEWGDHRAEPYHYGRWSLDARHGWVWVPDVVWAPSWVTWRSCDGWIGWAPTPPVFRWAGAPGREVELGAEAFVFVPAVRFAERRPFEWHASGGPRAEVFVKARPVVETVAFDGVVVNVGPPVAKVTVVTGVPVTPVKLAPIVAARRAALLIGRGDGGGHGDGHGAPGGGPGGPGNGAPGAGPSGKPAGPRGGRGGGHR